jgi:outer membrane protein OmpA-like peptidoglycan-associated protein
VRRVPLVLLVVLLVTALGACERRGVGGGEAKQPVTSTTQAVSTTQAGSTIATASPAQGQGPLGVVPMALDAGPAHVELTALSRTSDQAVTGQFRVVNDGPVDLRLDFVFYDRGRHDRDVELHYAASGIGLLDGVGNRLYMPLWTTDNQCLCSNTRRITVPPGGSVALYAVFRAPPAQVQRVTVVVPHAVPFQDVPIASGPVRPLADQRIDPASASLVPPRILAVGATVEGQEQSTDDSGADRAVRLSSDVLFAVNKADLTPRASALLAGVARQVDRSTDSTVKVDGYTDSTGNDAINQPLSQRRAQAVAQRLRSLVRRRGWPSRSSGTGRRTRSPPITARRAAARTGGPR